MTLRRSVVVTVVGLALIGLAYAVTTSPGRTVVPSSGSTPLVAFTCPSLVEVATSGLDDGMPYQCTTAVVSRFVATAGLTLAAALVASLAALRLSLRRPGP